VIRIPHGDENASPNILFVKMELGPPKVIIHKGDNCLLSAGISAANLRYPKKEEVVARCL
jgi:hypothetical protein